MKILGIDPGVATSGYGVISYDKKNFLVIESGWILTSKNDDRDERLISIFNQTREIIKKHQPDIVSIEKLFFFINAKTVMSVAEFMGVIKLAAALEKVPIVEYAPLSIKMEVTGNGRANKNEIKHSVRKILNVRSPKKKKTHYDDLCDALAVAICHAKKTMINLKKGGEKNG